MADQPDSYVAAKDVLAYLQTYADTFELHAHIRYNHQVIHVRPIVDAEAERWEIIVRHHEGANQHHYRTLRFDAVFVCTSHYSDPNVPTYVDRQLYAGNLMHSHAYRRPERFAGRSVLVIGAGASGFDLMRQIGQLAERIALSCRKPLPDGFMPSTLMRPDVERFTQTGVVFTDGSAEAFTDVIVCTGYKYSFPFLSAECGIRIVDDDSFVRPLFKECINIEHPTMFLLGLPFWHCSPFQLMDLQARFCLAFLCGRRQLPGRSEMIEQTDEEMRLRRVKNGGHARHMHRLDTLQDQYFEDLATLGGVEPIKPYVLRIFYDALRFLMENPHRFRKQRFRILNDVEFEKTIAED